eukprot:c51739_g1_i1 orf=93-287(+)
MVDYYDSPERVRGIIRQVLHQCEVSTTTKQVLHGEGRIHQKSMDDWLIKQPRETPDKGVLHSTS